jgi:topoisomerase-4 subunit A
VLAEFIDVKGIRANGNRMTPHDVKNIEISDHEEIEPTDETVVSLDTDQSAEEITEVDVSTEGEQVPAETPAEIEADLNAEVLEVGEEVEAIEVRKVAVAEPEPPAEEVIEEPKPEVIQPKTEEEAKSADPPVKVKPKFVSQKPAEAPIPEPVKKVKAVKESAGDEQEPIVKKKIKFEITNPDDVDIDDKGQLGLF